MSDFEEADFFVESWTRPEKKKRKNDSKKDKKDQKHRNACGQKKKKKPKFSETMMGTEGKIKEKKKKKKGKKKKKLEPDYITFTQVCGDQAKRFEELAASNPHQHETANQESKKKTKKKKMVAFGLSPVDIRIKRPKFASSPKERNAVVGGGSWSQVSGTGRGQSQPHDNDSQCPSDDINSQDLFITQKTFRASPVEASSSEASDRPTAASPQEFKQRKKGRRTAERERKHTQQLELKKTSFQTQTVLKANLAAGKKETLSSHHKVVNPFLDEPIPVASPSQRSPSLLPQIDEFSPLPPYKVSTSTQTESFFTSELSSFLSFCQRNRTAVQEDLKPLDLSLPQRVRKDLRLSGMGDGDGAEMLPEQKAARLPGQVKDHVGTSGSPQMKDDQGKDSSGGGKTPSLQSDAELKSADTTTSSEDDHHYRTGRRDPIQVKGIQMKLNKPFFFKTKGEGQSPRAESPLMKLCQDIQVKKRH